MSDYTGGMGRMSLLFHANLLYAEFPFRRMAHRAEVLVEKGGHIDRESRKILVRLDKGLPVFKTEKAVP